MSTDSYKLTYFDGRGLAEISRLIFTVAGVNFTDDRLPAEEDRKSWLALKPHTPLGKVPILHVGGHQIAQSKAIERFLCRRFGLYGCSEIETAQIDMVVEEVRDSLSTWYNVRTDAEKAKAFYEGDMRKSLENLNKIAHNHGYFVGNRISYADIAFTYVFGTVFDKAATDKALEGLDKLQKIRANVENNERIKAYVAQRKVTPF